MGTLRRLKNLNKNLKVVLILDVLPFQALTQDRSPVWPFVEPYPSQDLATSKNWLFADIMVAFVGFKMLQNDLNTLLYTFNIFYYTANA